MNALETRVRIRCAEWPTDVLYCQRGGNDNNNNVVTCICQCAVCETFDTLPDI